MWALNLALITPKSITGYIVSSKKKIKWKCSKCYHTWIQTPKNRKNHGCPECGKIKSNKKKESSFESFVIRAKLTHKNRYKYLNEGKYKVHEKINIVCPEHGIFEQKIAYHLDGNGCQKCAKLWESRPVSFICSIFKKNEIEYIREKRFKDLRLIKPLPIDIYIPKYNLAIEYNGEQHYKPKSHWGGEEALEKQKKRDAIKYKYCLTKGINLWVIPFWCNLEYFNEILKIYTSDIVNGKRLHIIN